MLALLIIFLGVLRHSPASETSSAIFFVCPKLHLLHAEPLSKHQGCRGLTLFKARVKKQATEKHLP